MSQLASSSSKIELVNSLNSDEEQIYLEEWTNSSRLLFYSIIFISTVSFPLLIISLLYVRCCQVSQYLPYFCAIIIANVVLLGTLSGSVMTENTDLVYDLVPGYIVCKVTAFLVNTSSCFIHWAWVAMYAQRFILVFFPLRARRSEPLSASILLIIILIFSGLFQMWTPIFITGRRLDFNNNQFDSMYCGDDPDYSMHSKIIVIMECIVTFFVPFALTVFADISVLIWKNSCGEHFTLVSNDELKDGIRKKSHLKIVSSNSLKNTKKRRTIEIRRCLISATITLLLNFPNYSLQLLDEFHGLRDHSSIEIRRIFLRIDAFFYILYLMQFPITPIHIFLLHRSTRRRASSRNFSYLQKVDTVVCAEIDQANNNNRNQLKLTTDILS